MKKEDAEIPWVFILESSMGVVQLCRISPWVKLCFFLYFQHSRAESKVANLKISVFLKKEKKMLFSDIVAPKIQMLN